MGNASITIVRHNIVGARRETSFDITMSSSYATNGDSIVAADLQKLLPEYKAPTTLNVAEFIHPESGAAGHQLYFDRANAKVKAFNGTTEIANGVSLATVVVRCILKYGDSPSSTT